MDTHAASADLSYVELKVACYEPSSAETKNVDVTQMLVGGVLTMGTPRA